MKKISLPISVILLSAFFSFSYSQLIASDKNTLQKNEATTAKSSKKAESKSDEKKSSDKKPTETKPTPKKTAKQSDRFRIVLLPDTQLYSLRHPETYRVQTEWIRRREKADNIKFVIHLGDIVHNNTEKEWKAADKAHQLLDKAKIPYSMVPGNHDMVIIKRKVTRNTKLYNKYFPPSRYKDQPWYAGHFGKSNDNNYCLFESHGLKFMVMSLEFCPRDEVLQWATEVIQKHPKHRVIVATHCYLNPKQRDLVSTTHYRIKGNTGQQMFSKLIFKQPNIFMVVCGHFPAVNYQTSKNKAGKKVIELLTDYQNLKNGGNGWLRTLTFIPSKNKIEVEAYSPLIDQYNKGKKQTFTMEYEMGGKKVEAEDNKDEKKTG